MNGMNGQPVAPRRKRRRPKIHTHRQGMIKPGQAKADINVTPLVDVVLVLLIIFMVVTPMLHRGVHIELPTTEHHEKKTDTGEQLVVSVKCEHVNGDGACDTSATFIETERLEGEQLAAKLKSEMKAGRPVHVRADKTLSYGAVRKVLEQVHEAGAQNVGMATEERKE
jgi:biopolymer transport protein TolR